ncbi:PDZ domain-containing protein [Marivirga atlantica]|jgi:predicted metalloprotease with PDZ domain|uniref:M61 family metallopeptidase n=1 Tax=Marivirga atlantica TaxID=1548457 RepID=A0A937A758_9BACT|nr:PDZ domain-containing protein [Marivirga atlantica]MBL0763616.1 M61 family metallopeptidase [Marivirga atlantica]
MTTKYYFSQKYPHSEFLQVRSHFNLSSQADETLVFLPAWRPGRYQLGNFSKYVRSLTAHDNDGRQIKSTKVSKDSWAIETKGLEQFEVRYEFYIHIIDGGSTFVDEDIWYLNFINCTLYTHESINDKCEVHLTIPDNWTIASSLKKTGKVLEAKNFYELVDSPVIAAKSLQHLKYSIDNTNFHLWFHGNVDLTNNSNQIVKDFKKFTHEQLEMMEEMETEDYHFLFQILPHKAYHGVEHLSSTSIILGPDNEFETQDLYDNFLGISSHELFHYWNIIRIRPKEMFPYNFQTENYFTTGYIAEGVTTYYGDLFLVRSKVKSVKWYLDELNKLLKRHFENYGRFNSSVAESSQDLWVDGYEAGTPHRKVSIYVKGAIIALLLDLKIMLATNGDKCLEDVIKGLWKNYYKKGLGYSPEDYLTMAEEVIRHSLDTYADKYIYGTEPIENELKELINHFGFDLIPTPNENILNRKLGIKYNLENDRIKIISYAPDSPAEKNLRIGDEIISIDGHAVSNGIDSCLNIENGLNLTLWRKSRLKQIVIEKKEILEKNNFYGSLEIKERKERSKNENSLRKKWLKN